RSNASSTKCRAASTSCVKISRCCNCTSRSKPPAPAPMERKMAERLTPLRRKVLEHIEIHSEGGKYGVRVPDAWIEEADASVLDGQSTPRDLNGRKLTESGRQALRPTT